MRNKKVSALLCGLILSTNIAYTQSVTIASKEISPILVGAFFEDLNYAADGGLYGELLQNRSFEYTPSDIYDLRNTSNNGWNSFTAWHFLRSINSIGRVSVETVSPIHPNNPHYIRLRVLTEGESGAGLRNTGYDGICVNENETYKFSVFIRTEQCGVLKIRLTEHSQILSEQEIEIDGNTTWTKYECQLQPLHSSSEANVEVLFPQKGTYDIDMVSLFPTKTYKGRANGLRKDLADCIEALHPQFMRFPGGCLAHGDGLDNIYHWKETIGPIEQRLEQPNIWRYRQSRGIGYHEYFQFCEDIGAEALPVVAAGVSCQNSARRGGDGQEIIPTDEMDTYIQDLFDLIEYCNGDTSSVWGRKRAENGHPTPFDLKYLGIGNEDRITPEFSERFKLIVTKLRERCPEIYLIGTSGPFHSGEDFEKGWVLARETNVWAVDEHYYVRPEWLLENLHRYDDYPRTGPKVYLGEWASKGNTWWNALCEAAYLCHLERNGDIVVMASYAPLLAHLQHIQWKPDLIYFDKQAVYPTVNYEIQRLFATNKGNRVWTGIISDEEGREADATSCVTDSDNQRIFIKMVNTTEQEQIRNINLAPLHPRNKKAVIEVVSGERNAQNTPQNPQSLQKTITSKKVRNTFSCTLPPYSVTIIKL